MFMMVNGISQIQKSLILKHLSIQNSIICTYGSWAPFLFAHLPDNNKYRGLSRFDADNTFNEGDYLTSCIFYEKYMYIFF